MNIKLLQNILDNLAPGIYMLDRQGNYIYCNKAFVKQTHYSEEHILNLNVYQMARDSNISFSAGMAVLKEKKVITAVNDVKTPSGYEYRQLITATPLFDENGELAYAVVEMARMDLLQQRYQTAITMKNQAYQRLEPAQIPSMIAESSVMKRLLRQASHIARSDASILLTGETGTGKEVLAQYIHQNSPRHNREMVTINCAALPENLIESELFGYEKGAFTGATASKPGLIEKADGGTLFLDEINSMPLSLQSRLLRVLETHSFTRVGGTKERHVNFRLLSATNRNLLEMVQQGRFRSDLYFRLAVVPIELPPLRERTADIRPLTLYFSREFSGKYGREKVFTETAFQQLEQYEWPGNVRELRNVIERVYLLSLPEKLEVNRIPPSIMQQDAGYDLLYRLQPDGPYAGWKADDAASEKSDMSSDHSADDPSEIPSEQPLHGTYQEYFKQFDREIILRALKQGHTTYGAAKLLGVNQSTVARKKKKYNL